MKKFLFVACFVVMSVFTQLYAQYCPDYSYYSYQRYMIQRQLLFSRAAQYANNYSTPWKYSEFPKFKVTSNATVPPPPSSNQTYQYSAPQSYTSSSTHSNCKTCVVCNGTGNCRQCGGSGQISAWRSITYDSVEQYMKKCPSCHTGTCTACNGSGKIYY